MSLIPPTRPSIIAPTAPPQASVALPWESPGGGTNASAQLQALVASLGGWWWDRRANWTVTGSGVSSWKDRIAGVADLVQGNDAKRPAYSGTTGLTFVAASGQNLTGAANIMQGKPGYTFIIFGSGSGNTNNFWIAYGTLAGGDSGLVGLPAGLGGRMFSTVSNVWTTTLTTPFALACYSSQGTWANGVAAQVAVEKDAVSSGSRTTSNDVSAGSYPAGSLSIGSYTDGTLSTDMVVRHAIALPSQVAQSVIVQVSALLHSIEGVLSSAPVPIMAVGDSITRGFAGLTGGWRPGASSSLGAGYSFVGPFIDTGYHRGVDGEKASDIAGNLAAFAVTLNTYYPRVVIIAHGENDLGQGATPAAYYTSLNAEIDQVQATLPSARIIVQSIVPPTAGHAYFANIANYTTVNAALPALCAAQGVRFANIGSPDNTIGSGSDGVHPIDGAAGYPTMVAPTVAQVTA